MRLAMSFALLLAVVAFADSPDPEPNPFVFGWDKAIDPDKDCKFVREKGGLTVTLPGKEHDLGVERKRMNAPRLLREVEGDFVATVRVGGTFTPSQNSSTTERRSFVGAGLVLLVDGNTYVRLERAALQLDGVKRYANWELRREGKWEQSGSLTDCPLSEKQPAWLRLKRQGNKLLASASEDGKKWTDLKTLELKLPAKLKLGVAACTTSTESFAPHYDRFTLTKGWRD